MPDPEDPNEEPTTGDRPRKATVTWRGIVDEPRPGDPPRHPRLAAVSRGVSAALVATGFKRGRGPDGELLPRKTARMVALLTTVIVIVLGYSMLHIVPAGNVLVPITLGDAQTQEGQGLHVTLPWPITRVASMSVQTQNYTMAAGNIKGTDNPVQVLGSDGASGVVDATVLYKLNPSRATYVFANIGQNFSSKLVQPASRACVRAEFYKYAMVDAATTKSKQVSDGISSCIRSAIEPAGIILQAFQMRQVVLASQVQSSINTKIAAQQNQLAQAYQILVADAKAQILKITALGTSQSQEIAACGGTQTTIKIGGQATRLILPNPPNKCEAPPLTEQELEYNYIQALRDLINSPTPNTIILGTGNGVPTIQLPVSSSSGSTTTTTTH
jgi:regulator of protease activity HflC (stomatin/prohibitin superfamily)